MGILDFLGGGVPHAWIGIYAPDKEGVFHRSLLAESWAAGKIEASVDAKTGILELREGANSDLKGQIVLSCNLKTIGTQHSIEAKRPVGGLTGRASGALKIPEAATRPAVVPLASARGPTATQPINWAERHLTVHGRKHGPAKPSIAAAE